MRFNEMVAVESGSGDHNSSSGVFETALTSATRDELGPLFNADSFERQEHSSMTQKDVAARIERVK